MRKLNAGSKLYYIDKKTEKFGEIKVTRANDEEFEFYLNGKRHKLPYSVIGSRLYLSQTEVWNAWKKAGYAEKYLRNVAPEKDESICDSQRDKVFMCAECGKKFVWTVGEQRYYEEHNLSPPRTCSKECKKRRKYNYKRKCELQEYQISMLPSNPYRTGSKANEVHVSGSKVKEISGNIGFMNIPLDDDFPLDLDDFPFDLTKK